MSETTRGLPRHEKRALDRECAGVVGARKAAAKVGTPADLVATVQIGAFSKELPGNPDQAATVGEKLLDMVMLSDAAWLDEPFVVHTPWGDLTASTKDRCLRLELLANAPRGNRDANPDLLVAAGVLEEHLFALERVWYERRVAVFRSARRAEMIAAQALGMYLAKSRQLAEEARERYISHDSYGTPLFNSRNPEWKDLLRALDVVRAAYTKEGLEALDRDKTWLSVIGTAVSVSGTWAAWTKQALGADGTDLWRNVSDANRTMSVASQELAEATLRYLQVLRREAERHPILLPLHLKKGKTGWRISHDLDDAVTSAVKAINWLQEESVNRRIVARFENIDELPSCSWLARTIGASAKEGVWKLPFFMDRALNNLPPRDSDDVRAMMELSQRIEEDRNMTASMAIMGMDAAMSLVVFAGPVGVGLAMLWGLVHLATTVKEYESLQALFRATIDPSVLLRGLEHEEASKMGIALDLIGLIP